MLKKRIIPIQLIYENRLVKSKQFKNFRNVGDPIQSASVYNSQSADELIILNIDRKKKGVNIFEKYLKLISEVCFVPLSIGGGINNFEDVEFLFRNGADKIIINSLGYKRIDIIKKIVNTYGSQALIIAIDVFKKNDHYHLYSDCGKKLEKISLKDYVKVCKDIQVGEFFIQSINNDGMMDGFDIDLIKFIQSITDIPIIAAGGSGNYNHLKDLFLSTNVNAIACGSLFNFTDSNPLRAKAYLQNYNIPFKVI